MHIYPANDLIAGIGDIHIPVHIHGHSRRIEKLRIRGKPAITRPARRSISGKGGDDSGAEICLAHNIGNHVGNVNITLIIRRCAREDILARYSRGQIRGQYQTATTAYLTEGGYQVRSATALSRNDGRHFHQLVFVFYYIVQISGIIHRQALRRKCRNIGKRQAEWWIAQTVLKLEEVAIFGIRDVNVSIEVRINSNGCQKAETREGRERTAGRSVEKVSTSCIRNPQRAPAISNAGRSR